MIEALNHTSAAWLELMLAASIHNCLFIGLILALLFVLRGHKARLLRHIAILGLVKIFILPLIPAAAVAPTPYSLSAVTAIFDGLGLRTATASTSSSLSATSLLYCLWLIGALGGIIFSIRATGRMYAIAGRARALPSARKLLPTRFRHIPVLMGPAGTAPFVIGFRRCRILVPPAWEQWSVEHRRAVLHHECAHLAQGDQYLLPLVALASSLHFFNPLVWPLLRKLREFNEMACDESACRAAQIKPFDYARILLATAESRCRHDYAVLEFSRGFRSLRKRIRYLNLSQKEFPMQRILLCLLTAALLPFLWNCEDKIQDAPAESTLPAHAEQLDQQPAIEGGMQALAARLIFPAAAKEAGIEGKIFLKARVTVAGAVDSVVADMNRSHLFNEVQNDAMKNVLSQSAIKALLATRFVPARRNGEAVPAWISLPVVFRAN